VGTTRTFRFREYAITPDDTALPAYQAVCVAGDTADCGADSGDQPSETELGRWIAEHTRDTGHTRFRRARWDYAQVEPGAWQ
jgi:hypothetical protein